MWVEFAIFLGKSVIIKVCVCVCVHTRARVCVSGELGVGWRIG